MQSKYIEVQVYFISEFLSCLIQFMFRWAVSTQSFIELPLWVRALAQACLTQVTMKLPKPYRPTNSLSNLMISFYFYLFQTPPEQSLSTLIIWIFQVKYGLGLVAQVIKNAIFSILSANMNPCPLGNVANTFLFECGKEQTGAFCCCHWPTEGLKSAPGHGTDANSHI